MEQEIMTLTEHEDRRAKVLREEEMVTINQLPIEIILVVISYACSERPLVRSTSRCIRLSWVCGRWRTAILNNAVFWTFIILDWRMALPFFRELLRRSKNLPLEILVEDSIVGIQPFIKSLGTGASRVKTLYTKFQDSFSHLLPIFPSLENIFCDPDHTTDITFKTLLNTSHLKALQTFIINPEGLEMTGRFRELRWLSLTYGAWISIPSLVESLQTLPNLQVLHLSGSGHIDIETLIIHLAMTANLTSPIVTLPELKALFLKHCPIMNLVNAPKLSYLDVSVDPGNEIEYDHYCGFDFSRITHIYSEINPSGIPYIMGKDGPIGSENGFPFTFNRCHDAIDSIFDEIPTSYPNQFRISMGNNNCADVYEHSSFTTCLKKSTNAGEIILYKFSPANTVFLNETPTFFKALLDAATVRNFTVLSGTSFQALCFFLNDGRICPNLERLIYINHNEEDRSREHLRRCLPRLSRNFKWWLESQDSPVLRVELTRFDFLEPEALTHFENNNIQVIQE